MSNILTCVYCGMAYPEGTPPHGAQVLTDHIKACEKHPMRRAEEKIQKLRNALIGLIGAESKRTLQEMEIAIMAWPIPDIEKTKAINGIHAILETAD